MKVHPQHCATEIYEPQSVPTTPCSFRLGMDAYACAQSLFSPAGHRAGAGPSSSNLHLRFVLLPFRFLRLFALRSNLFVCFISLVSFPSLQRVFPSCFISGMSIMRPRLRPVKISQGATSSQLTCQVIAPSRMVYTLYALPVLLTPVVYLLRSNFSAE